MGKPIQYAGTGEWKIMIRMPERLAQRVHGILLDRGCTCAELARAAIADYADRVHGASKVL